MNSVELARCKTCAFWQNNGPEYSTCNKLTSHLDVNINAAFSNLIIRTDPVDDKRIKMAISTHWSFGCAFYQESAFQPRDLPPQELPDCS